MKAWLSGIARTLAAVAVASLALAGFQPAAQADSAKEHLKPGLRLAIIGDSITEQKLYSAFIEAYLLACCPEFKAEVCQFGWGGEQAGGFAGRMQNDLEWYKPDMATLCYGMNDGGYKAITPDTEKNFEDNMRKILEKMKADRTFAIIGGPGAVDTKYFTRTDQKVYNDTLAKLAEISGKLAGEYNYSFASLHSVMMEAMAKGKAANGDGFDVCGTDGIHPRGAGHLVMAYAFLKAMGVSGEIGSVTLSMGEGKATVSEGHKALSSGRGHVEIESVKYPFCLSGTAKDPASTLAGAQLVPFVKDLNRFTLQVKGLAWKKVTVTWGKEARDFSKEDLEKGVNLIEFYETTPFKDAFDKLFKAVVAKQNFETVMIKRGITNIPALAAALEKEPNAKEQLEGLKAALANKWNELLLEERKAMAPVKHSIKIEKADEDKKDKKDDKKDKGKGK